LQPFLPQAQETIQVQIIYCLPTQRFCLSLTASILGSFLARLNVNVVNIQLTYSTPKGFYESWSNQFYIFDILKYLNVVSNDSDVYIILDSDCVWLGSVQQMVHDIRRYGVLTMDMNYPITHIINGLTRIQMKQIYEEISGHAVEDIPPYFGGEFFGGTGTQIRAICNEIDSVWDETMQRFRNNLEKFNEEAHMLSYIYNKLGYAVGTANQYIKRIWTGLTWNNVSPKDLDLVIWHLPGEKKYGLRRLFKQVSNPNSEFWNHRFLPQFLGNFFGIPRRSFIGLSTAVMDRVKSKFTSRFV
jgi:hypothetical protein